MNFIYLTIGYGPADFQNSKTRNSSENSIYFEIMEDLEESFVENLQEDFENFKENFMKIGITTNSSVMDQQNFFAGAFETFEL